MSKVLRLGMVGLFVLCGLAMDSGMAALFDGWRYRADVTFAGYGRSEALTNFPALVILNESTIPGFTYSYGLFGAGNGADLRFANADGTLELPYEIEKWDLNGSTLVWVQVPSLVGANTKVTVYWGKSNATAPSYTTDGSTWDAGYMGVWHMKEASAATLADSSGNANDSTANTLNSTTAIIDGGMAGDASQWAAVPDSVSLKWTNLTVESWVNLTALDSISSKIIGKGLSGAGGTAEFVIWYFYPEHKLYFGICPTGAWDGEKVYAPTLSIPVADVWYHVVGRYDGTTLRMYANGVELGAATDTTMTPYNGAGDLYIGAGLSLADFKLAGKVDEQRVSNVARSTNYIYATWLNQASNSAFVAYGGVRDLQSISFASGWASKMKIGFEGYDRVNAPLTNFPALVVLNISRPGFRYNQFDSAQGADLRFVNSNEMVELSYEIEKWDPDGSSLVWVKVPELVDSNSFVWAFWGKDGATAPAYTTNGSTWDGNYMGVWHLKEASGAMLADSTVHTNHSNTNTLNSVAGVAGGGMGGTHNRWAEVPDSTSLKYTNLTVESWVLLDDLANSSSLIGKGLLADNSMEFMLQFVKWTTVHDLSFMVNSTGDWDHRYYAPNYPVEATGWYHVVGRYDRASLRLYINGAEVGTGTSAAVPVYNGAGPLMVGAALQTSDISMISGRLDEQRVSNVARSPNYIYASWLNQASNDVFVTCEQVTHPSGTAVLIR